MGGDDNEQVPPSLAVMEDIRRALSYALAARAKIGSENNGRGRIIDIATQMLEFALDTQEKYEEG